MKLWINLSISQITFYSWGRNSCFINKLIIDISNKLNTKSVFEMKTKTLCLFYVFISLNVLHSQYLVGFRYSHDSVQNVRNIIRTTSNCDTNNFL